MTGFEKLLIVSSVFVGAVISPPTCLAITRTSPVIADHIVVVQFDSLTTSDFSRARNWVAANGKKIFYGHTSHGSQIMGRAYGDKGGMDILERLNPSLYAQPAYDEEWADLGSNGNAVWVTTTRNKLGSTANPNYNVIMWSWCGGLSSNSTAGVDAYLTAMTALETEYPTVTFVYMTGHLDGSGSSGTLFTNNNRIRNYVRQNNKVLFDFADIETYDPGGTAHPDDTDACTWCSTWCRSHTCPACDVCAHSHCFNCYQKGKAFWWLLAQLSSGASAPLPTATQTPRPTNTPILTPTATITVQPTITPQPTSTPEPTNTPPPTTCRKDQGDANCDQVVNEIDLHNWLFEVSGLLTSQNTDFNSDGLINTLDYAILRRTISGNI